MAQPVGDTRGTALEVAWKALWDEEGPYYLPLLLTRRVRARGLTVAPLTELPISPTGSIKLLRKAPWGIVALELEGMSLTGLNHLEAINFAYHPDSPVVSAELAFTGLELTGTWRVDTGGTLSPAARTVVDQVVQKRQAMKTAACGLGATGDQGLTQATNYRGQLVQTANGRSMVGAYYDNNDAYNEIMATHAMNYRWTTHQTDGQSTADFANQTVTTTAPGATQSVNGQPDAQGYSSYNAHALYMQVQVMATAYALRDQYNKSGNTARAQQMQSAGDHASGFGTATKPVMVNAMTAGDVMNTVATSSPPRAAPMLQQSLRASEHRDVLALVQHEEDPQWMKDVYARSIADFREWGDPDQPRPDKQPMRLEQVTREQLVGRFSVPFNRFSVTLTGVRPTPGGTAPVEFTDMRVRLPEPVLTLDGEDSPLLSEVQQSLDAAGFLRGVLRYRIEGQLQSGGLMQNLNAYLHFALTQALGAVR